MADYISRQKAIEAIMDLPNCPNGYSDTYDKECIIGILEEVPTADVVEVVRCKDCEYYQRDLMWGHGYCYGQKRKEDWFCADGRRRDDGNN